MDTNKKTVCFLTFLLLFFPLLSLAADPVASSGLTTNAAGFFSVNQDLSRLVLSMIFGTVGGVLLGTGGQLIGQLVGIFNGGLVIVIGVMFGYTLLKFVLHASSKGDLMADGGRSSPGFVVIRSVMGLSLAIPSKATGYCIAQTIVMWVVLQGVGFANQAWGRVVDYLAAGGSLFQSHAGQMVNANLVQQGATLTDKESSTLLTGITGILQSQICLYQLRNQIQQINTERQNTYDTAVQEGRAAELNLISSDAVGSSSNKKTSSVTFGSKNKDYNTGTGDTTTNEGQSSKYQDQYNNECGYVRWDASGGKEGGTTDVNQGNPLWTEDPGYLQAAVTQLVLDMQPYAKAIADGAKTASEVAAYKPQTVPAIAASAFQYLNLITPLRSEAKNNATKNAIAKLSQSKALGWIMAGTYYRYMGQIQTNLKKNIENLYPKYTVYAPDLSITTFSGDPGIADDAFNPNTQISDTDKNTIVSISDAVKYDNFASDAVAKLKELNSSSGQEIDQFNKRPDIFKNSNAAFKGIAFNSTAPFTHFDDPAEIARIMGGTTAIVLGTAAAGPVAWVTMPIIGASTIALVVEFMKAVNPVINPDPILALQQFGFVMMDTGLIAFMVIFAALGLLSFASSWAPSFNLVGYFEQGQAFEMPLVFVWLAFLFTAGAMLGIYLPFIYFIVWFPAVIGWVGQVIQAMVAAPLVALRIVDPEGEGIIGKAGEGVTMLFGVFLTPILLVIGFTFAVVVIRAAIRLLNASFGILVPELFGSGSTGLGMAWAFLGVPILMFIYTLMVMEITQLVANMCISDGVRAVKGWFASAMAQHTSEQIGQQMKSGIQSAAGEGGQLSRGTGGATGPGQHRRQAVTQARDKAPKQTEGSQQGENNEPPAQR